MAAKKNLLARPHWLRHLSQFAFGAFIIIASIRHSLAGEASLPSTDALCPFGGLEALWSWITTGNALSKTHLSNIVLGLGLLIGVILAGGAFCGWICPFGAIQELLVALRRRLHLPEIQVPAKIDRWLTYGRYVVLTGILYATISSAKLWFADYDPYRTLFSLGWLFEFNWAEQWPAYLITLGVLIGAFLIPRFWCRYLCPLGGVITLLQRFSLFRIRREDPPCIHCNLCTKACPVKLPVSTQRDTTTNCIGCLECTAACPKAGALDVRFIVSPTALKEKKS